MLSAICLTGLLTLSTAFGQLATNATNTRFTRGVFEGNYGFETSFQSTVIPVDFQKGVPLPDADSVEDLFPDNTWTNLYYHFDGDIYDFVFNDYHHWLLPFKNPIAAFGGRVGGSPMYVGESYRFGVYAGILDVWTSNYVSMRIQVYGKADMAYVGTITIGTPFPGDSTWTEYVTNGYTKTVEGYGLTTTIYDGPYAAWGGIFGSTEDESLGAYLVTHRAAAAATNYIFVMEIGGAWYDYYWGEYWPMVGSDTGGADDTDGKFCRSPLYTIEFDERPPLRPAFVDQPHFNGTPLPSFYAGKSLEELQSIKASVTNLPALVSSNYLQLNHSPELRNHPILDQFVADMGNDPLALVNYVINEVGLTDTLDFDTNHNEAATLNVTGVNRSALAVFQESQGSPLEQCALLVYLLREAGVPATYLFPTNNGIQVLDTQLSQMLGIQLKGAATYTGVTTNVPHLIPVNYPWVTAYIGTNWVHIFPWMKDTEVVEGLDLYSHLPTNYNSGSKWAVKFIEGDTNIMSLGETDQPTELFPKFVEQSLLDNYPGISLDDIGMKITHRKHLYARWEDLPAPFAISGTPTVMESLSANPILLNTIQVKAYSAANTNKVVDTGELYIADMHNRPLVLRYEQVGSNNVHNMILTLGEFSPAITNRGSFGGDVTCRLSATNQLDASDDVVLFAVTYNRNRFVTNYGYPSLNNAWAYQYTQGADSTNRFSYTRERARRKGDAIAFCLDTGRVTKRMLDVHAQTIWRHQMAVDNGGTPDPDAYLSTMIYLMGMSYWETFDRFRQQNHELHKLREISNLAHGFALMQAERDSNGDLVNGGEIHPIRPSLDIPFSAQGVIFNGTSRPDSGNDVSFSIANGWIIDGIAASALEHDTIKRFFNVGAQSTVGLLQAIGATNIVRLDVNNYVAQGNVTYNGVALKNHDTNLWANIVAYFSGDNRYYNQAFLTPGVVTNGNYTGMAVLYLEFDQAHDEITGFAGGLGEPLPPGTYTVEVEEITVTMNPDGSYKFSKSHTIDTVTILTDGGFLAQNNYTELVDGYHIPAPENLGQFNEINQTINPGSLLLADNYAAAENSSWFGKFTSWLGDAVGLVADPVNAVTGEFYVDAPDLTLNGPMPLSVRRNYLSLNRAANEFGYGWKMNYAPSLSVRSDESLIYAAEADGSLLAYRQSDTNANLWVPQSADNPNLNNLTRSGISGLTDMLQARIERTNVLGTNIYTLFTPNGSRRTFEERAYSLGADISRERPYLTHWQDNRGNSFSFAYGEDAGAVDYGLVRRIQSSNGNFLGFYYDVQGHMVEAYTGDGRRLYYDYDGFGDLRKVTLPDASEISYEYEHLTFTTNAVTYPYSTHLLTREIKPDGRVLENIYDSERRVVVQKATVGPDLKTYTNAVFTYVNDFTNAAAVQGVTGYTTTEDIFGRVTRYDYTNSQITKITDPLLQTVVQEWYPTNSASPNRLKARIDVRNLRTDFVYDQNGNVLTNTITGDLTGTGNTNETARTITTYNSLNLPTVMVDPSTNTTRFYYADTNYPYLATAIARFAPGDVLISSNDFEYESVSEGSRASFGLLHRTITAAGSSDAATNLMVHDARGFVTEQVRFTGNGDPAVTNQLFYNDRGELVFSEDAAGQIVRNGFDGLGRPILREVYGTGQSQPLFWEYSYFNGNGELVWSDGPRYNPEDYVWRDYDGAGHKSVEIRWHTWAKDDGSGVEAASGEDQYATWFNEFDGFGNLTRAVDPRGAVTTNGWDELGRLSKRTFLDLDGSTVLSSESFGYEPGGQVRYHTNGLGGVTETQYTSTGQPAYRKMPDGSTNAWRYYTDGRIHREIQRNGAYWETTYNDANRASTRIFYSAGGSPLATNITVLDRRGNVFTRTDAGGNTFTNYFDGLNRLKWSAGPMIVFENPPDLPAPGGPPPPIQQTVTNFYDAAGVALTNLNAVGEKTVTLFDALGRTTRTEIRSAANALVRESSTAYRADHHGLTVTNGSGASAIVSTTFTDNNGQPVLSLAYPNAGLTEFTFFNYDLAGNLTFTSRNSLSNGVATTWSFTGYDFDGLNRMTFKVDRNNALTYFSYNALNNLILRTMPGGLEWQAEYNSAGQLLKSWNQADSAGTRTNSYSYYAASTPFAGLQATHTDGRGVECTMGYDDFLRPTTNNYSGPLSEHDQTTLRQYDARGLLTQISESFVQGTNGPSTAISRSYDSYGQLAGETISVNGVQHSTTSQQWDSAGRRGWMSFFNFTYHFGWQADGLMSSASAGDWANGSYGYSTAGLLNTRTMNGLSVNVTSRDGVGRILARTSAVNSETQLSETLAWTGDGLLSAHSLARTEDFTDARSYDYATYSRRLEAERLKLTGSTGWTNVFGYDGGNGAGAGVLTRVAEPQTGGAEWTAELDGFNRIEHETNNVVRRPAKGRLNATPQYGTVSVALDGRALAVNTFSTSDTNWPTEWRTEMELRPGTRTLTATAQHSSKLFTTNSSVTFTNNAVDQTTVNHFAEGQLSHRVWVNSLGQTNRVQTFAWDGRSRLIATTEVDDQNNGYNWTAVYDALGRRLKTTTVIVTNGFALTNQPKVIASYFDPGVEFLELGVNVSGKARWKVFGPDLDGRYGGMNGTGGFDGVVDDVGVVRPVVSDARGNVHGLFDTVEGQMQWNGSRPTGYGAVPEYRPLSLSDNGDLGSASAWRGRWPDRSGLYWLGARYYDPVAGRFISCDPYGHDADPSLYAFADGDPINRFDPDGRIGKQGLDYAYHGGAGGQSLTAFGGYLEGYQTDSALLGAGAGFVGSLANSIGGMVTPATYANGAADFGTKLGTLDAQYGHGMALSYGLTSWNVGAIGSGIMNVDYYSGEPIGDWMDRGTVIAGGVANTAGIATAGLGIYNLATAPAVPPVLQGGGSLLPVKYDPVFALQQGADASIVVPDSYLITKGGLSPGPTPGTTFSASMGSTLEQAASTLPHGKVQVSTAGQIRNAGGNVTLAPEPFHPGGPLNWEHVNVTEGGSASAFQGQTVKNPQPYRKPQ
jgi:RHS repeat-associated protein